MKQTPTAGGGAAAAAPAATFIEASRDGALTVELDSDGNLIRCELAPEVNATWTADRLGGRIVALYGAALMRVRLDQLRRINEAGADVTPGGIYPTPEEIAAYRAEFIDF